MPLSEEVTKIISTDRKSGSKTLYLGVHYIGKEGVTALAGVLSRTQITELSLDWNRIEDGGAEALAGCLKDTNITSLYLGGNNIGDEGAKALAQNLPNTLTDLRFYCNQIGKEGAIALAGCLKDTNLTSLDLGSNQIGYEGAKALAEGLKDTNITSLDLGWNQIGNEGATALAESLKDTNLTSLNLGNNKIGKEGVEVLNKALEANRERIKNEVMEFKDKFLSISNEFKDVDPIIKSGFTKFGKYAFANHIEKFLKPDEKMQVKAKIVCGKIPIIDNNIASKISEFLGIKFLDIKDCLELNAIKSTPHHNSSTEEAEHGAHAATLSANEEGLQPHHTDLIGQQQEVPDLFQMD